MTAKGLPSSCAFGVGDTVCFGLGGRERALRPLVLEPLDLAVRGAFGLDTSPEHHISHKRMIKVPMVMHSSLKVLTTRRTDTDSPKRYPTGFA